MRAYFDFPLIFLVYLTTLLYFCIWRFSWILLIAFIFSCVLAIYHHFWKIFPILLIVASVCWFIKTDEARQMAGQPVEISQIEPIIDTIEVNGNLLSFRGKDDGNTYQV